MSTPNSPEEDETKKKGSTPADAGPTDQDPPATNIDPILNAQKRASTKGYLFGQILRGVAGGVARGLLDEFLDGS